MTSTSHFLPFLVGALIVSHTAIADPPGTEPAPPPGLTHVPGTRVSLTVPRDSTPAQRFPGFIHEETGAFIYVTEGFSLEKQERLLIEERSSIGGVAVVHLSRRMADEHSDTLVTIGALAPESAIAELSAPLTATLRSAQLDPLREVSFLEPSFALQRTPGLQEDKPHQPSTSTWQTRVYSAGGGLPAKPTTLLSVTLEPACLHMPPADMSMKDAKPLLERGFATEPGKEPPFAGHSVTPVTVDGLQGWELVFRAKEEGSNLSIYQMLLREGSSCYRVTGFLGRPAARKQQLARFKTAARSFKRLDAPVFILPLGEKDFVGLTHVRGTRLFMAPPPGFVESKQFVGFTEEDSGAFIEVFPGQMGVLFMFPMDSPQKTTLWGIPHRRMLQPMRDVRDGTTLFIVATFPEKDAARLSEPLSRALKSIRVKHSAEIVEPSRDFKLTPFDGMEEYDLGRPPKPGEPEGKSWRALGHLIHQYRYIKKDGPTFFAAFQPVGSRIPFDKLNTASAKQLLKKHLDDLRSYQIESISPIQLDGLKGWEITAVAKTPYAPGKVLYQIILPQGVGFYSLKSTFLLRDQQEYLPLVQAMARSFKRL